MNSITLTTLSHIDPTFYEICCYENGDRPEFEMHDIFVLMTTFRRNLSFQWIESIREDLRIEMLTKVIITLLSLADDKNTTLRLAAYSTIGTLILSVAPYSPSSFITAFADAIPWMSVSSKISIAIINSFISLMRFISPVRINTYIEKMPILHHFSADVSDFIQFLPITIPSMKKLPPEFLINILNSLLAKCGNSPNGYFSTAISMLVNLKRKLLLPELSKRIIQKNYDISAVWIGRNLFSDRKTYDVMDMELKRFILDNAFEQLHRLPLDLSRFDYSCRIIATALRYELDRLIISKMNPESGIDEKEEAIFYELLKTKLKDSLLDKYSSPFRNSLLVLPTDNLDSLIDVKSESDSFRASKITAITNYFFDYIQQQQFEQLEKTNPKDGQGERISLAESSRKPTKKEDQAAKIRRYNSTKIGELKPSASSLEITPSLFNSNALLCINTSDLIKGVADRVAEMLYLFVDSQNDLFSTLLENLSRCMNELLIRCKKRVHITMLKKIFAKHYSMKLNWVQHMKLAQLINNINPDLAARFIPNYLMTVTKILLDLTISPTDKLFHDSVDVLCNIASYETLPKILDIIKYSDWYTESIVYKRFYLLAKLAKMFKSDLFTTFVGIGYECLFFCELKATFSVIFWFLSKVNIDSIPDNVKEFSFTFVEKCYFSYAHQPIYKKSYVTDDFVEYDADIVTNPLIDHKTALSPLWHCYRFLCHISTSMKSNLPQLGSAMVSSSSATINTVSKSVSSLSTAVVASNNGPYQFPSKSANPSINVLAGRNNLLSSENLNIDISDSSTSLSSQQQTFLLPQDLKRLYHYSIPLVKIFGRYALQMAAKLSTGNKKFEQEVYNLSLSTFLETDDDKVAATCVSIFISKRTPIPKDVREMLSQFIGGRFTDNLDLLFLCFSGVNMEDHRLAVESVPIVAQRQWLPVKTTTILLFKLIKLLGTDIVMSVSDENALAFLPLANLEDRKNISTTKCVSNQIIPTTSNENSANSSASNVSLNTSQIHGFSGENLIPQKKIQQDQDYQLPVKSVKFGQSESVIYSEGFYKEKVRKYINEHHFSEFPIENDELKMSLLKFLRKEPRILLKKSELLDTVHWKFIFENIDCFDISEVSNYIDGNPSVFSKIELSSYSLFSQTFTLLPLNRVPLFASITPFVALKKEVPNNLSLFRSFALFSGQRLNMKDERYQNLFEQMILYAIKSRHIETIKAMMEYALRFNYQKEFLKIIKTYYVKHCDDNNSIMNSTEKVHFSNNPHEPTKEKPVPLTASNTKDEIKSNAHAIRNLKSYTSVVPGAIHSHKIYLTDKIFFTDDLIELTAKIDPESVLHYLGLSKDDRKIIINNYQIVSDNLRATIITNISNETKNEFVPDFYLDYFINTPIYKKKQYLLLIKLLETVTFSIKKLSDLVIDILPHFKDFSNKKKHVFIRFITQSLQSLSKYQVTNDFKSFMNCLVIQFSTIAMGSDASILLDFSYLFGLLAEYAIDGTFFVDFLNTVIGTANSIPPLYLISTSKLVNKKIIPVLVVDPSLFTSILESELPSLNCGVLRALTSSHVTNHITGTSDNYNDASSSTFYTFNQSSNEPKIVINNEIQGIVGEKLSEYKQSFLIADFLPDFVNYATEISEKYTEVFLSDKNHPCFSRSLRCRRLTSTALYNLFKLSFTTPEIIGALVKFTYNKKYMNTQIIEYFKKFQETIVYSLLVNIQLAGVSEKIVRTLFSDLPSSFDNFLVLFCFLRRFYARANVETKRKIRKFIELKADKMSPQSRFFSLMMLCEDSLKEIYLGFFVAATESNDFSRIAQEYDRIIASS